MSTSPEIRQVIRGFYLDILGGGESGQAESLLFTDLEVTAPGGFVALPDRHVLVEGAVHQYSREDVVRAVSRFHEGFSDIKVSVESIDERGTDIWVRSVLEVTPIASAENPHPLVVVFRNRDRVQFDDQLRIVALHRGLPEMETPMPGSEAPLPWAPPDLLGSPSLPSRLLMLGFGPLPGYPTTAPPEAPPEATGPLPGYSVTPPPDESAESSE